MEEQQIQEFVHRVSMDQALRAQVMKDPDGVIMREGFSPRVTRVLARLIPHLSLDHSTDSTQVWWGS